MNPHRERLRRSWAIALMTLATAAGLGADGPTAPGKRAVAPIAPAVPGPVLVAMQDGKYAEASTALERLVAEAKSPADKAYYRFVLGIASRLGGKPDDARAALTAGLEGDPKGPWTSKIRFELATVELAAGRPAAAEALARVEAESLLAPDRKDRLAEVYHAFARRLLNPEDPVARPDPVAAHAMLAKARELAKGEALRASLLFAMGKAAQSVPPQQAQSLNAIADFEAYLKEYPRGLERDFVRFHLGGAQLASNQFLAARLTWTDLARDLARSTDKGKAVLRARSMFAISRTYGIPNPTDVTQLNLGIAALRKYLADYPADQNSVVASYDIGSSYRALGQGDSAIEAFNAFLKGEGFRVETDEARRDLADLSTAATFQVAETLKGQGKFDRAIEAYRGYLARFPNGPHSADSQRSILDAQLMAAADLVTREKYAEARAAWMAFVGSNPLDPRVPGLLYQVGDSLATEHKPDEAIASWDGLIGKFPGTDAAWHAQFDIAAIYESDKGDPAGAIERFRKVTGEPWKAQADQRIAVMEAKTLTVVTPRTFRSGETAHLKISTRNLENLTFTAYKLNAEAYFRKKHVLGGVPSLDVGLVAPDAEWTVPVAGYARYKPVSSNFDLKVAMPGTYVVKVTDEKTLQATALVVGSDLDAIVKASREQVLVFAQDMKTGKGRKGARVLIADGTGVVLEKTTGDDGVLLTAWEKQVNGVSTVFAPQGGSIQYLVLDGPDAAGSALGTPGQVAQGLTPRAYLYTDRPAYRPGQEVAIRGIVREAKDGQYANPSGETYKLEVTDAKGRLLLTRSAVLSAFGTFHEVLKLDSGATVGDYRIRLSRAGQPDFSGAFEVRAYKLEKLDLEFDLAQTVYYRGDPVKAGLIARYQYGAPVANRPIEVFLPDGRVVRGTTDASGKFAVEFPTDGFSEEQALRIVARLPGDNVQTAVNVMLAIRGFRIDLATTRDVYLDGETFAVDATTVDAQGKPTGRDIRLAVIKQVEQGGRTTEREVSTAKLTTDKATGKGRLSIKIEDAKGGSFTVRALGTDQFGNAIVSDRVLTISGQDDATRLRLLTDRQSFKVGESATVNLHSRSKPGTALLTWEADRILKYDIVPIKAGDNAVAWPVDGPQFPNFTLTASRMAGESFDEARLDIRVERDLRVSLKPTKSAVGPGEEVEVEVTAVDQNDKPVAAEIALALVDRSLLRLFEDKQPTIGPYFYSQTRTGAFTTISSNTFHDDPATMAVSEAVVEEAERQLAQLRNDLSRGAVLDQAKAQSSAYPVNPFRAQGGLGDAPMTPAPAPASSPVADPAQVVAGRISQAITVEESKRSKEEGFLDSLASGAKDFNPRVNKNFGEMSAKRKSAALSKSAAPQSREPFAETAYWNPSIVTDANGKATVKFKAPNALSEYRFSAKGVTGADTLVGQASGSLTVRKDFFVDLKVPAELTQGDKPRFIAQVHHKGIVGPITLSLSLYSGDREQVYPKTIEAKVDGVDEVMFDPFDVPDASNVRLSLTAKAGEVMDSLIVEVPVRPWGVQAFASASGSSSDGATAFVGLPAGRTYESPEMRIDIAPSLKRLLIDLAMDGPSILNADRAKAFICSPVIPDTIADRASDLLAAASTLAYLRETKGAVAADATRLADRVQSLVSELVSGQNDDGGWAWIPGREGQNRIASNRMASARVVHALSAASSVGLGPEPGVVDKAMAYVTQEFVRSGSDAEARAALLHGMAAFGRANFEQANALNRSKLQLNDVSLAYLALTLAHLDRAPMALEALEILGSRAKLDPAGVGKKPRKYWEGVGQGAWHRGSIETTAVVALAYAKVRPQAPELDAAVDYLLAHRLGDGWSPHKAKGSAVAALADYYGRAKDAEDRYRLVVLVNDAEVYRAEVTGPSEGKVIVVPRKVLKVTAPNAVRFLIEGRGTFGYAVTMTGFARDFGPDQKSDGKPFAIVDHFVLPAEPEFDGKILPTGFGTVVNPAVFTNKATQVAQGGRVRVWVVASQTNLNLRPAPDREFLMVEETLPAGTTLIDGSVQSTASSYTLADNVLTFYYPPESNIGRITYDVAGYLPGQYRALPTKIHSAYDPGIVHLGPSTGLKVLSPGEATTDPYRPTPDELFARGKALFDAGRLPESAEPLEELFGGYTPRDDVAKLAARMLLTAHIKDYQARKVVQDFEVLKEKGPELIIPFDEVLVVGRAYRDINEHERAYLVFRAIAESSYLEDAQVGEALRQRGRTLEGMAYLLDLWRDSPNTPSIESDFFGLSQVLARAAEKATSDPALRRELAEAGVTRSELLGQSIRVMQLLLTQSPTSPMADEVSLSLVGGFMELEDFDTVLKLAPRFAKLYPRSKFLDSFQFSEALAQFSTGKYDRAIEVAQGIANATYVDPNGLTQPSPNKWEAVFILGQIFDARRQPARALDFYRQVSSRFADAGTAVNALTRKALKLPEVSIIRPGAAEKPSVSLDYRNITEVDVKVYPVDLMRLYLTRRNLDAIAGIDLAGITPLLESTVKLGDGLDFADKVKSLDLPITKEGAYLIMVRGENLYASGIALVTPIEIEVLEESDASRVRVVVRDAKTKDFVPKVQVKVIGSDNPTFFNGKTDLRGVYTAEGVNGQVTAVARLGTGQYAFYRGTTPIGNSGPRAIRRIPVPQDPAAANSQMLNNNLRNEQVKCQTDQIDRLQNRLTCPTDGIKVEQAK